MSNQFTRLNIKSNNEWYTPEWVIKTLLTKIKPNSTIWCPFDTITSQFVKVLSEAGHKVVYSHYDPKTKKGNDFLEMNQSKIFKRWSHVLGTRKIDYIISNPPFKGKCDVIDKCIALKIPYILLLGNSAFTQNGRMQNYLNNHKLTFIEKPVEFFNKKNEKKKFLCFWLESK